MMHRLNKENLPPDEWTYVTNETETWERVKRYENGLLKKGEEKGIEKGIEIGEERGIEKGKLLGVEEEAERKDITFVLKLHARGENIAEIASLTELSEEKVTEILANHKK